MSQVHAGQILSPSKTRKNAKPCSEDAKGHTLCSCKCCIGLKRSENLGPISIGFELDPLQCLCNKNRSDDRCAKCLRHRTQARKAAGQVQIQKAPRSRGPALATFIQFDVRTQACTSKSTADIDSPPLDMPGIKLPKYPKKKRLILPKRPKNLINAEMKQMMDTFQLDLMSSDSEVDDDVFELTKNNIQLQTEFLKACDDNYQMISPSMWMLPDFTRGSFKPSKLPCYTMFWNFKWMCSCQQQSYFCLQLGLPCWHIQWIIEYLEQQVVVETSERCRSATKGYLLCLEVDTGDSEHIVVKPLLETDQTHPLLAHPGADLDESDYFIKKKRSLYAEMLECGRAAVANPESHRKTRSSIRKGISVIKPAMMKHDQKSVVIVEAKSALLYDEPELSLENDEYVVEKLVKMRHSAINGKKEFLVKWAGWKEKYNSWVYENDLTCPDLVAAFDSSHLAEKQMHAELQKVGYLPQTMSCPVRYHDTSFFLVPYGDDMFTKFCIVGPDKAGTRFKCKNKRHANAPHHIHHANVVVTAIEEHTYAGLSVRSLLWNFGQEKNKLAADANKDGQQALKDAHLTSLSTKPINIMFDKGLQQVLQSLDLSKYQGVQLDVDLSIPDHCKCVTKDYITPDGERQIEYGTYKSSDEPLTSNAKLYCDRGSVFVDVRVRNCKNDNKVCRIHFDGQSRGIFNFTGATLVSYTVLMDFVYTLLTGNGTSFVGFVAKMNHMYKNCYGSSSFLSVTTWISCFLSWVMLVQAGTRLPFCCAVCGPYPRWLCFDGVSLACSKRYIQWNTVDTIPHPSDKLKRRDHVITKRDRLLLKNRKTRELLNRFMQSSQEGVDCAGLWKQLITTLNVECKELSQLLQELHDHAHSSSEWDFIGAWAKLFAVFGSADSITFFLHPIVVCGLQHFVAHGFSTAFGHLISHRCPILYDLFAKFAPLYNLPASANPLFKQMISICTSNFPFLYAEVDGFLQLVTQDQRCLNIAIEHATIDDPSTDDSLDEELLRMLTIQGEEPPQTLDLQMFPQMTANSKVQPSVAELYEKIPEKPSTESGNFWYWDKIRSARVYSGLESRDPHTAQWAALQPEDSNDINEAECKKIDSLRYNSKDQIAGLFVGCCPHTICYGYHLMLAPEGRKDLYKVLVERMPQEVLDQLNIIYDAACQAAEYCITREPNMFALTNFFVDRFHSLNHTCSPFWKLTSYPDLAQVKSTSSESLNDYLQKFHGQVAYMQQSTYMRFVEWVSGFRNYVMNQSLSQQVAVVSDTKSIHRVRPLRESHSDR